MHWMVEVRWKSEGSHLPSNMRTEPKGHQVQCKIMQKALSFLPAVSLSIYRPSCWSRDAQASLCSV